MKNEYSYPELEQLRALGACSDGLACAASFASWQAAWDVCPRVDWMLWACRHAVIDHKTFVRIACDCARLALPYVKGDAARECIETVELWLDGRATIEEVREKRRAADAAYAAAADAAAADAAAYAAAAADAADAAYAAADAYAYAAADAAAYADVAADAAAYAADARKEARRQCADIVRKHITTAPTLVS